MTNVSMSALPALPAPIFRTILAFALYESDGEQLLPRATARVPYAALRDLALVAKDWTRPIRDLVARHKLSKLMLEFHTATRSELAAHRRNVTLRGAFVRDLKISFGRYGRDNEVFQLRPGLHDVADVAIPWRELFRRMPDLRRLDISEMPLTSPHTRAIVEEASVHCMALETLLLPGRESEHGELRGAAQSLVASVYTALERWYLHGGRGGVRTLSFPGCIDSDGCGYAACSEYIETVTALCPRIEHLDSYRHSLRELDRLTTNEQWLISLETWTRFNAACSHLRAFNWVVAPFADDFFQVFGAYVKPQLTRLTFGVNMFWDWDEYARALTDAGEATSVLTRRGDRATDAKAALAACPALRELEVCFYHPVDDEILENEMDMIFGEHDYDFLVSTYPETEVLDPNVFGDAFCRAIAVHCPLLERLTMWEVAEQYNSDLEPIEAFTDAGLEALATLKWLTSVELRSINCTGRGLFVLLNAFPTTCGAQRDLQIAVGGASEHAARRFYTVVTQLLTQLCAVDELAFAHRKVVLRLVNASLASVSRSWSKRYLKSLKTLVQRVQRKHPCVQLRVALHGRKQRGFASIAQFGLFTPSATPSPWHGWDASTDGATASVFFDHGGRASASDDFGSDSERAYVLDHLPIDFEPDEDFLDYYGSYGSGYGHYDVFDGDAYDDYDDVFDGYDHDDGGAYD